MDGDEGRVLCVILTCRTEEGAENVLLSRYFDDSTPADQVEVEAEVWEATCEDVANISDDEQRVALVADKLIAFTRIADLVIYIVGAGELVDELVLSEFLTSFVTVMRTLIPKGVCLCVCARACHFDNVGP